MRKIKLLALDLDGTVLTSENRLPDPVRESLKKAIAEGIVLVAASGRPYGSMPKSILGLEGLAYCVTSNGACVYDGKGNKLSSSLLSFESVEKILELTEPYDLIFEAFIDGKTYTDKRYCDDPAAYGCSQAYVDYVKSSHGKIENMRAFVMEHKDELDSLEIACTDSSLRTMLRRKFETELEGVYVTSSSENFIELMSSTATKANGVRFCCEREGILPAQTASCGNADNDVDMIKFCGLGTAVGNASQKCLDCADMVLPTNNECGVCILIDTILS